jgi:hypothetical protein
VDQGAVQRWSDAELLQWLSVGQRAIVMAIPGASQLVATLALVAGTRQLLPLGAHILLGVNRNLSAAGVPGPALLPVERSLMDTQYPTWHTQPPVPNPLFYTYDRINDPVAFYVYPPNDGTGSLELNYSVMPIDVATVNSPLTVRDIFQVALLDFVLYKAHCKDSDYAAGQQAAQAYFQAFSAEVNTQGGKP